MTPLRYRRPDRSMDIISALLTLATPCTVALILLNLAGIDLSLRPEPARPLSRLSARPYFSRPPALILTQSPVPMPHSPSPAAPETPAVDAPLETTVKGGSVQAYLLWLQHTDQIKRVMFHRAVEHAPNLQAFLPFGSPTVSGAPPEDTVSRSNNRENDCHVAPLAAEEWERFLAAVDQQPYPVACQELHDRYTLHLKALRDLFIAATNSMEANPTIHKKREVGVYEQTLEQARGNLEAETSAADGALAEFCRQVGLQKAFDITVPLASP